MKGPGSYFEATFLVNGRKQERKNSEEARAILACPFCVRPGSPKYTANSANQRDQPLPIFSERFSLSRIPSSRLANCAFISETYCRASWCPCSICTAVSSFIRP
jgi:hypothetical protein